MEGNIKKPSLGVSLAIILFLFISFAVQLIVAGSPDVHMTLIFASVFAVVMLRIFSKMPLSVMEEGILHGTKIATISMMILMFIGVMIPAWIAAGTIPSLIYYGVQIISPSVFLLTTILVCSLSTLATGTSWGTAATFGVALMGIGGALGVDPAMTAGAVISGAIFGDKLSPISDTVNLSAATCEVNIFDHIKAVSTATIPGYILALIASVFWGLKYSKGQINDDQLGTLLSTLSDHFNVTPVYAIISLIPVILVIVLALRKFNALATIVISALTAMIIAIILQGYNLLEMMSFMNYGFVIDTGNANVDKLMNRGGLQSMMWTVSIGYLGLSYGGILEKSGVLDTLLYSAKSVTGSARNLILAQMVAGFATVAATASPYVSILIPGRMFVSGYDKLGIKRTVASRTLEHSGICLDPILPWSLGAVYFSGVLGVSPLESAPYNVLCWSVPLIAAFYAVTGIFVPKEDSV